MKVSEIVLVLAFALGSLPVLAEEGGGEGGEAKSESERPKVDPAAKLQREFQEKKARFGFLEGRISSLEKEVQELAHKKNSEMDEKSKKEILDKMAELVVERNKYADQFNTLKTELAYRYPSQGETLDRSYQTQTKKTVEEIEGSIGLDELLTRTKKMVDKKYAPFIPPKQSAVPAASSTVTVEDQQSGHRRNATAQESTGEEKPKRLRFER